MWVIPTGTSSVLRKKNQVRSPSHGLASRKWVRIRQSGRTGIRGVTSPLGHSARSPAAHFDEVIYPTQAMQPKESDQLRLKRHQGLSVRSLVTHFDEVIYSEPATQPKESDQIRLERHQGLSARSPVARFDEVIYSAQVTLPEESDQLRLHH